MVKTTVYLDDETAITIKGIAKRKNTTRAEFIRDAVRKAADAEAPPRLPEVTFDSGFTDTTARRKEILEEAILKGRWRR